MHCAAHFIYLLSNPHFILLLLIFQPSLSRNASYRNPAPVSSQLFRRLGAAALCNGYRVSNMIKNLPFERLCSAYTRRESFPAKFVDSIFLMLISSSSLAPVFILFLFLLWIQKWEPETENQTKVLNWNASARIKTKICSFVENFFALTAKLPTLFCMKLTELLLIGSSLRWKWIREFLSTFVPDDTSNQPFIEQDCEGTGMSENTYSYRYRVSG